MKISDLIAKLKSFDPNTEVVSMDGVGSFYPVTEVETIELVQLGEALVIPENYDPQPTGARIKAVTFSASLGEY
jgi:hypothetical protein